MHRSSYLRMEYLVNYYGSLIREGKNRVNVLDIGSCGSIDSTYRNIFDTCSYDYCGLDMSKGPNVDIVPKDIYQWTEIEDQTYDLVISGQTFEHIEYPWLTMKEIARVLKASGFCIIIAPSFGKEHFAPVDCYRFYSDGMSALARQAGLAVVHVSTGGVPKIFETDDWVSPWNDTVLVAQKQPITNQLDDPFPYEKRVGVRGELVQKDRTSRDKLAKLKDNWKENVIRFFQENSGKKIVLYGIGPWCDQLLDELIKNDLGNCIKYIFSSSPYRDGTIYNGYKVFCPTIEKLEAADIILISNPNYASESEIYSILSNYGTEIVSKVYKLSQF